MSNHHNQKFVIEFSYDDLEEVWFTLHHRVNRGCPEHTKKRLFPHLEFLNYILSRHTPGMPVTQRVPEFEKRYIQTQSDIWTPGHEIERMSKVSELCKQMLPTKRLIIR